MTAERLAMRLHGRGTSHFTRVVLVVAHELEVPIELVHVEDLFSLDPSDYGGHPALKVPCLHLGDTVVFGAENAARRVAAESARASRIVWPEAIDDDLVRNAQELVWTAMGIEVSAVLGTIVRDRSGSGDDALLRKARVALSGVLGWLDEHLDAIAASLPSPRETSLLEITLFCLIEHVRLRATVSIEPHARLVAFASRIGERPSSIATAAR